MKIEFGLIAFVFFSGMVAQDHIAAKDVVWVDYGENPMTNPQFMADWTKGMTPQEAHASLAAKAGEWDVQNKLWMAPGTPPMESTGTSSMRMVLGGRYLLEEYKSSFMGMPFEGMLIQGYDNLSDEYVSIWLDTMSTWPSILRGKKNGTGVLTSTGMMRDVSTPTGRPSKFTVTPGDGGTEVMEMFDSTSDGKEFRSMEMVYKRASRGQ